MSVKVYREEKKKRFVIEYKGKFGFVYKTVFLYDEVLGSKEEFKGWLETVLNE